MARIALLYTAALAVFVLLANTQQITPLLDQLHEIQGADKLAHFVLIGTFTLLANLAFRANGATTLFAMIVPGTALAIVLATCEELSNLVISVRCCSLGDLVANYLGIFCIGVLPMLLMQPLNKHGASANGLEAIS